MYKIPKFNKTSIKRNDTVQGETLEEKIDRIVNNKEPIKDGAPLIYTERKDGVEAGYNIRTDRFDIAIEAMDKVHKSAIARREERAKDRGADDKPDAQIGKTEPIQGTDNQV